MAMFAICSGSAAWLLLLLPLPLLVLALVAAVVVIQAGKTAPTTALATAASCLHMSSAHQNIGMHASKVTVKIRIGMVGCSSHQHPVHCVSASTHKGAGM
jgi:hypothetical protein